MEELGIIGRVGENGKPNVKFLKEYEIDSLEIRFVEPVYIWEQEMKWDVTVAQMQAK